MPETEENAERMECTVNSVRKDRRENRDFQVTLVILGQREKLENQDILVDQESKGMPDHLDRTERVMEMPVYVVHRGLMEFQDPKEFPERMASQERSAREDQSEHRAFRVFLESTECLVIRRKETVETTDIQVLLASQEVLENKEIADRLEKMASQGTIFKVRPEMTDYLVEMVILESPVELAIPVIQERKVFPEQE